MTIEEMVQLALDVPAVSDLTENAAGLPEALTRHAPLVVDNILTRYDWDFVLAVDDDVTVVSQAEYTLTGSKKNCRDIINIRYGDDLNVLDKKSAIDMDEFLTDRTVSSVHWWYPSGRSANGFPQVTLVDTPETAGVTIRYRYRRNDLSITKIPDEFRDVLVKGLAAALVPEYVGLYEKELRMMIDRYSPSGGEDNPAKLSPEVVRRNNDMARAMGYS